MKRLCLALALMVSTGCADTFLGPSPAKDNGALFDEVWREFDLHYSYFAVKHINWDSLGAHYRPLALSASTETQFASVLAHMLGELHDAHVALTPGAEHATLRQLVGPDTATTYFVQSVVFNRYVPSSRYSAQRHLRYGMATPTVGYISIPSFVGGDWSSEMDEVLDGLPAAQSIIIDVRNNVGGTYVLAAAIAGRFADRERTFGYVRRRNGPSHDDFTDFTPETVAPAGSRQFRGPVVVLSNRKSVSTSENFILAMKSLPSVTIVGDTTAGASGAPIVRELSNGWTYQLSEWIEYTSERQTYEDVGLAPNIVVRASATDMAKNVDAVLERAITVAITRVEQ
jgi:C-terminal processing protease CtpA/Prc